MFSFCMAEWYSTSSKLYSLIHLSMEALILRTPSEEGFDLQALEL